MIAEELRLSDRDVDRVAVAALLHDVGKIYEVFAPILQKPGRLTEEEWEVMKTHPVLGADLVATVAHLRHAVPSIRGHHENWDGTGYPDGLAGERIPLGARIISVADTIDALLTDRPYRKRLTSQDVRAELVRCRGTQFDPRVCDVVLSAPLWVRLFPEDREEGQEQSILALRRRSRPAIASGRR
jgi:HD-GYP domain-containing protein (c-di-GMP phosphodiesterase class II)